MIRNLLSELASSNCLGAKFLSEKMIKNVLPEYESINNNIEEFRKYANEINYRISEIEENLSKYNLHKNEWKEMKLNLMKKYNVISILGERGTGKTSILKSCRYSLFANKKEKNLGDVVLPLIVPEEISGINDALGWVINFFSEEFNNLNSLNRRCNIFKSCNECNEDCDVNEKSNIGSKSELKKLYDELYKSYLTRDIEYNNKFIEGISNYNDYQEIKKKIIFNDRKLIQNFFEFIDNFIEYKKKKNKIEPLIFVFFDDVDLANEKCFDIINTINNFLLHPNIVVFVTGDQPNFIESMTIHLLNRSNLRNLSPKYDYISGSFITDKDNIEEDNMFLNALNNRNRVASDCFRKVIPAVYSYKISPLGFEKKQKFVGVTSEDSKDSKDKKDSKDSKDSKDKKDSKSDKGSEENKKLDILLNDKLIKFNEESDENSVKRWCFELFGNTVRELINVYLGLINFDSEKAEDSDVYQIVKTIYYSNKEFYNTTVNCKIDFDEFIIYDGFLKINIEYLKKRFSEYLNGLKRNGLNYYRKDLKYFTNLVMLQIFTLKVMEKYSVKYDLSKEKLDSCINLISKFVNRYVENESKSINMKNKDVLKVFPSVNIFRMKDKERLRVVDFILTLYCNFVEDTIYFSNKFGIRNISVNSMYYLLKNIISALEKIIGKSNILDFSEDKTENKSEDKSKFNCEEDGIIIAGIIENDRNWLSDILTQVYEIGKDYNDYCNVYFNIIKNKVNIESDLTTKEDMYIDKIDLLEKEILEIIKESSIKNLKDEVFENIKSELKKNIEKFNKIDNFKSEYDLYIEKIVSEIVENEKIGDIYELLNNKETEKKEDNYNQIKCIEIIKEIVKESKLILSSYKKLEFSIKNILINGDENSEDIDKEGKEGEVGKEGKVDKKEYELIIHFLEDKYVYDEKFIEELEKIKEKFIKSKNIDEFYEILSDNKYKDKIYRIFKLKGLYDEKKGHYDEQKGLISDINKIKNYIDKVYSDYCVVSKSLKNILKNKSDEEKDSIKKRYNFLEKDKYFKLRDFFVSCANICVTIEHLEGSKMNESDIMDIMEFILRKALISIILVDEKLVAEKIDGKDKYEELKNLIIEKYIKTRSKIQSERSNLKEHKYLNKVKNFFEKIGEEASWIETRKLTLLIREVERKNLQSENNLEIEKFLFDDIVF